MLLKIGRVWIVTLSLLLLSSYSYADKLTDFPFPIKCEYKGIEYRCFDLEDMKSVKKIEIERDHYHDVVKDLQIKLRIRTDMFEGCRESLHLQDSIISNLSEDRRKWFNKYIQENKARHKAENKPDFMKKLGWGAAGGFALTTLVLGTIIVLD